MWGAAHAVMLACITRGSLHGIQNNFSRQCILMCQWFWADFTLQVDCGGHFVGVRPGRPLARVSRQTIWLERGRGFDANLVAIY